MAVMSIYSIIRASSGRHNTYIYGFLAAVSTDIQLASKRSNEEKKHEKSPAARPKLPRTSHW